MYIVIFCSVLALFWTYLESIGKIRNGMRNAFCILALLGMIHYDYGNDYMSYYQIYKDVTLYNFDLKGIFEGEYFHEPGWALLCWLFKPIGGFFMMVAVLNIIQNVIMYRFIKQYVGQQWWWLAMVIYLFTTSFYLLSFSMMRQEFVIIVFLGMWQYIVSRRWWIPLIVFILLSYIHSSAWILLPVAFWGFVPVRNSSFIISIYVILFFVFWLFKDVLNSAFIFITSINNDFSRLSDTYIEGTNGTLGIGLGFWINIIPFILSIIFLLRKTDISTVGQKQMVALASLSFLIAPFDQIIPLIGRVGMYFAVFKVGAIPIIYRSIKIVELRVFLLGLFVLMLIYDYFMFFGNPIWMEKYSKFQTIFPLLF